MTGSTRTSRQEQQSGAGSKGSCSCTLPLSPVRLGTTSRRMSDTPNSNVTHAGVNHLRLARCRAVTQAIVGSAQIRAALDHLARHTKLRLSGVVALLR